MIQKAYNSLPFVGVHVDLKYLMPRKSYLQQWLQRLPEWGINTLLLEYEDKFPYQRHRYLRDRNAFSEDELRDFLDAARQAGLRVVPLVQSLSHLEFALAHEPLAHLRQEPGIHTQINPDNPDAITFVNEYIDEVLSFHGPDEFVHIGADEAWHLTDKNNRVRIQGQEALLRWADHLRPLLRRLLDAGKRPIVFDDMLWREPTALSQLDLPAETVLHSWDYNATQPEGLVERVKAYRDAGHDVIGGPCLNWGVLTPRHEHCLANTAAWGEAARQAGLLGLINTAWACFHVPQPAQSLHIAATARCLQPNHQADRAWQEAFFAKEFGVAVPGLVDGVSQLGRDHAVSVKGIERPITPVIYGYMDMLLHFGTQRVRKARGIYPLDWSEIRFDEIYATKVKLLREHPDHSLIMQDIAALTESFGNAQAVLKDLVKQAHSQKPDTEYWLLAADLKSLHAQIVLDEIKGTPLADAVSDEWCALGGRMREVLHPFLEDSSVDRALSMWWTPVINAADHTPTETIS